MLRTKTAMAIAALTLTTACAREAREAEATTTTVTSGTTHGVRVTNVRLDDERPTRVADELCRREAACNRIGDDRTFRSEEACMSELSARTNARMAPWRCSSEASREHLEECLAAIRSEACETPLVASTDHLPACRASVMCAVE
jgi:hypothetical protein